MMTWPEIARTMEAAAWLQALSLALSVVNLCIIVAIIVINRRTAKLLEQTNRLRAQGIEARSDETLQAAQPEGQEPGPAKQDAP